MKVNRLETHDRLLHFKKDQSQNIFQGAEDCLKKNPDSLFFQYRSPYVYVFAHPRTIDEDERIALFQEDLQISLSNPNYIRKYKTLDDVPHKVMLWQPRLWKPKAQTNSYLFRAKSHSDIIQVCWLLPPEELWGQYILDNVTGSEEVLWSINQYQYNRKKLEMDEPDDLSDERGKIIMQEWISSKRHDRMMKNNYGIEIEGLTDL